MSHKNTEKRKEYQKKWRLDNQEKIKSYRKYYDIVKKKDNNQNIIKIIKIK